MCLIIDTNCFSHVFNTSDSRHEEFKPVLDFILDKNGVLIWGGTTYFNELKDTKYNKIFSLLRDVGKVVRVSDKEVDQLEVYARQMEPNPDFDDPHLVGIVGISKCKVVCTLDMRCIPYLQTLAFYPIGVDKPKFYTSKRNQALLSNKYFCHACNNGAQLKKSVTRDIRRALPGK